MVSGVFLPTFISEGASPAEAVDHVLQEQDLRRAGLVGKAGLRLLAFLAAKRRIGQHDVEYSRRALEQAAEGFLSGERIPMPQMRTVDPMQDKIG